MQIINKIGVPSIELKPGEQIPRLIHYCWFGRKPIIALAKRCMGSWKKYLPGYNIMLWNEDSFDIESHVYVKEAYQAKKWAFVTDYVRLYALYNYGGIYMDTDVEIIKPIDRFLKHSAFSSFESPYHIPTGLMASFKKHPWIKLLLDHYNDRHFLDHSGSPILIPNTEVITLLTKSDFNLKVNNTYQVLKDDVHIYPTEFFCPMNWLLKRIEVTENTYAIHHFAGSWIEGKWKEKYIVFRKRIGRTAKKIFGRRVYNKIADISWRKFLKLK